MTKKLIYVVAALIAGGILIQFIPIDRSNPPVTAELQASADLKSTLKRACYDCHSNETVWPWYSRVAPVSWLVASDTWEGREHLNFSTWGELAPERQRKLRHEIWEEVEEGEMPPWIYLLGHDEARLGDAERNLIRSWSRGN